MTGTCWLIALKLPTMTVSRLSPIKSVLTFATAALLVTVPLVGLQALELRTEPAVVLELFTSQGCPRCPDADKLLSEIGEQPEIVALAYHVDYWDYAGWEDTFALPVSGELQKAYAAAWDKNRIYTPQMVVNGTTGVVGSQRAEVNKAIESAALDVPLALSLEGNDTVVITAEGLSGADGAIIWLVTFRDEAKVEIERGENTGRELTYTHIVTGRQAIGTCSKRQEKNERRPSLRG